MEGWEKVIITDETFEETIHGQLGCIACHGGNGDTDDKDTAHTGINTEPITEDACDQCHTDLADNHASSLHEGLEGYYTAIQQRTSEETWPHVEEAFGNHCESCHTSCGQCHVSRPTNVGGGLSAGHQFKKIPPMNTTCTGCHGSRVNDEYKGGNEGYPADVHWTKAGLACFACHEEAEMHGTMDYKPDHRYDGPVTPGCATADCHADLATADTVPAHDNTHLETMACQTCHTTDYKNCYSCHVQKSEDDIPYFKIEPSVMDTKIGYNPIQSDERPWKWVILRHVPVDPDTFVYYGENLMPNFDNRPTWEFASPHAIQHVGPQAQTCNDCHGNADVFLTVDDLLPYEIEANRNVVVDKKDIPPTIENP